MTTLLAALLAFAPFSHAEEFVLAANGPALQWMRKSAPAAEAPAVKPAPVIEDVHASASCFSRAKAELSELTPFAASQLCGGALDADAPIACYKTAARTDLTTIGRVTLCAAATAPEATVGCYEHSARTSLGGFLRVQLCSGAVTAEGPVACWRNSRPQSDLPVVGRVKLCSRR